jgi:tryptophanyl-tRNA synthetase
MNNPKELEAKLSEGEAKAREISKEILGKVRTKLGF